MQHSWTVLVLVLFTTAAHPASQEKAQDYSSTRIDKLGQLHIVLTSGNEVIPPKIKGQVAFSDPLISSDHRTVGWLADYPDPGSFRYRADPIAGELVLYRNGRVLQRFTTDQIFWDWKFADQGSKVAYSTGPSHGGASECILREIQSGVIVARWHVEPDGTTPEWVQSLRY